MSEMHNEQEAPIRAWLSCRLDGKLVSEQQDFPTARVETEERLARSGIASDRMSELVVTVRDTTIEALAGRLPRNPDLDELNYLAARIEGMGEYEREVFGAVMESGQCCGSLTEIINAAENLDRFDLYPGDFDGREFGGIMHEMHANEHWEVMERLRTSDDPQEKSFAAYVERMESSLDLVKYGRLAREEDNGALTGSGYLLLPDEPLPERYTGPQDIPTEYRLAAPPAEAERKPSLLGTLAELKAEGRAADASRADAPERKPPSGPEL